MSRRSQLAQSTSAPHQCLALAIALGLGAVAPMACAQSANLPARTIIASANAAASAAAGSSSTNPIDLRSVHVEAQALPTLASPKYTAPLLDTPQTIQVITSDLIEKQGATTLTEALKNSPGVGTFYVGENGNTSTGDAIQMRGFDASSSIFVDGIRDMGSISRDIFNIDHIEVTKGPAGTDNGRTAPSGAINMVTKQPQLANHRQASLGYGSGDHKRLSADWNQVLSEANGSALRINVMDQRSGVVGRDTVENNPWGIAPSLAFGQNSPT
ncbi:MAG: TonB-dependent receptor plug domain-containing protein, partial [Xanthomonadales bacterium]|nr:TonB-dependent receptor plug domain-containing protein [Xanthomonadales bacterium]